MPAMTTPESVTANTSLTKLSSLSTSSKGKKGADERNSRAVTRGRILFLLCLLVVAAVLSTVFYYVLKQSETELATVQYESIGDRALDTALEISKRKRLGTITMASIAGNANPNADAWPFVTMYGYEEYATELIRTSNGREMGFAPLVTPDQLEEFEQFAYNYYYEAREPPFENTTAVSPFGRGVWGAGPDGRYHETDGSTSYDSPNSIFAPILHHNEGSHPALLVNLRFEATRGNAIDRIIECSNERISNPDLECGEITDMLILTSQEVEPGPGALLIQPIYPGKNSTVLTGILASSIVWDEVLVNVFSSEASGIDCVLATETQIYTYSISHGEASLKGEGDLHDKYGDDYRMEIQLTGDHLYSDRSANYTLTLYPTREFFDVYSTKNPAIAAFGAAMCIVLTSLLFVLYDSYVRKEFNSKIELLEAKRKFVRFVSHEVRTPLNSVCMGLSLMLEEIGAALGVEFKDGPVKGPRKVDKSHAIEWMDLAQEILVNAQSSVDVLNDLLNYDKIEMGNLSLELTVISIWSLIERTAAEFKVPAAAKNIALQLDFGSSDTEMPSEVGSMSTSLSQDTQDTKVVGDNVRVTQVLRNLLSNALKFTKDGGKLNVRATWKKVEGEAAVTKTFTLKNGDDIEVSRCGNLEVGVTDTGAGMSKEQVAELFRDGVQFNVNELQAGQGSGLGLFIAKGIAEQHGGTLAAFSEGLGHGTTFTVKLPLFCIPDEKPKKGIRSEEPYKNNDTTGDTNMHIQSTYQNMLIVDDVGTNRKLLRRLLQNHGHTVTEAEDGIEAVEKMEAARKEGKPYDTILLDYEMPRMNGPDACKEMRTLGSDSFIVGVTGNVMAEDVEIFKDSGANGVLPKPFKLTDLDQLWQEHGVLGSSSSDEDSEKSRTSKTEVESLTASFVSNLSAPC